MRIHSGTPLLILAGASLMAAVCANPARALADDPRNAGLIPHALPEADPNILSDPKTVKYAGGRVTTPPPVTPRPPASTTASAPGSLPATGPEAATASGPATGPESPAIPVPASATAPMPGTMAGDVSTPPPG